jgi:two-component sensor histidine kinase
MVKINLSTALPLGLMLNEIMLNSFKHSYKGAIEGITKIVTSLKNDKLSIEYCDCKGQFPEHIDFKKSNTTGLTLIHTFAEQLNGSIELINNMPPKYSIQIPLYE